MDILRAARILLIGESSKMEVAKRMMIIDFLILVNSF